MARLPAIHSLLRAGDGGCVAIEVLAQRDARHVRGIALTPTQGLARGMPVQDTGGPLQAPVGKAILSRMFDVFGNTIDREPALADAARAVAIGAPPTAAAGAALDEVRGLRDRHQGHRRAHAAGARRQGGPVRRCRRRQDGAADRDDPQHDRPPGRREHLLRHRRAFARRRGAVPRDEGRRRAAPDGDDLRADERAAGRALSRRATRR
jgi:hypothetical protein